MRKAAGIIIKVKDKCLLCKRNATMKNGGEWSIPGGKKEKGEDIKDAAHREFYEEMNLKIPGELDSFLGIIKRMNREGDKQNGVMYVFGKELEDEIQPDLENAIDGTEHTECKYFSLDELPEPIDGVLKEYITNYLGN